ncbi:DUF393 domain-containing protein [bacterium]|nr:DUF393 domain-containing protein [bacterium]
MHNWKLKIFYDGACPLCSREMRFLMRKNTRGTLVFEDTTTADFDPQKYGISTDVNRVIHAALPDGSIVTGVEVFRRAYREIGLGWLLAPTGWPGLKSIFDLLYLIFAKNRKRISRFFPRACKI